MKDRLFEFKNASIQKYQEFKKTTFWNEGLIIETKQIIMDKERSLGNKVLNTFCRSALVGFLMGCAARPFINQPQESDSDSNINCLNVDSPEMPKSLYIATFNENLTEFAKQAAIAGTGKTAEQIQGFTLNVNGTTPTTEPCKTSISFIYATDTDGTVSEFLLSPQAGLFALSTEEQFGQAVMYYEDAEGEKHNALRFPKDMQARIENGEVVQVDYFPTEADKNLMPGFKDEYITFQLSNPTAKLAVLSLGIDLENDPSVEETSQAPRDPNVLPEGAMTDFAKSIEGHYDIKWSGENELFEVIDNQTQKPVEGLQIDATDPSNPIWIRTYMFTNPEGESVELVTDGVIVGANSVNVKDKLRVVNNDSEFYLSFPGWKLENGTWIIKNVIDPNGKETKYPKYSVDEIAIMMLQDCEKITEVNWKNPHSKTRQFSIREGRKILGFKNGIKGLFFNSILFPSNTTAVASNTLKIVDRSGNTLDELPVMLYGYMELKNSQTLVAWTDETGLIKKYIVDGNLGSSDSPIIIQVSK